MNSKISKLFLKSKNTDNILQEILNTINISSTIDKNKKAHLQYNTNFNIQHPDHTINIPSLKKIDILITQIINEMMQYHKLSKYMLSFASEQKMNSGNIDKSEILDKLGIFNNDDKSNIIANINLPLLYFIIYYFIQSINENYQKIINFFNNTKNNLIVESEELISQNLIKKYSQKKYVTIINQAINNQQEKTKVIEKNDSFDKVKENFEQNVSDSNNEQPKIETSENIFPILKKKTIVIKVSNLKKPPSLIHRKSVNTPKFLEFKGNIFKFEHDEENFSQLEKLEKCPFIEQSLIY